MNTETMGNLAQDAGDKLVSLWERWDRGDLTREQFIAAVIAALNVSRARAVALADLGAAADVSRLRGTVVTAVGLPPPPGAPQGLVTAVLGSAAYALAADQAMAVLGRSETLRAAQEAHHAALAAHGVTGWTRVLNAGACALCNDLAGEVLPMSAEPYHHKGCGCSTRPVNEREAS